MVAQNSVAVAASPAIMVSGRVDLRDELRTDGTALINANRPQKQGVALCQDQENTGRLGGRLIAGQEAERKRISRELHDGLGQDIADDL